MEEPLQKLERDKQQIPVGTISATDSTASPLQTNKSTNPTGIKNDQDRVLAGGSEKFPQLQQQCSYEYQTLGAYIARKNKPAPMKKRKRLLPSKVPVDQFENMINQLPGEEDKVLERKISTEDVTGDIVDTKARLEARKQMRAKYPELLKQSKNMEDALSVQNSVNGCRKRSNRPLTVCRRSATVARFSVRLILRSFNRRPVIRRPMPIPVFLPASARPSKQAVPGWPTSLLD